MKLEFVPVSILFSSDTYYISIRSQNADYFHMLQLHYWNTSKLI